MRKAWGLIEMMVALVPCTTGAILFTMSRESVVSEAQADPAIVFGWIFAISVMLNCAFLFFHGLFLCLRSLEEQCEEFEGPVVDSRKAGQVGYRRNA